MACFASVMTTTGRAWINLEYVLRVDEGVDGAPTTVRMTNGEVLKLAPEDAANLLRQLTHMNGAAAGGHGA